jgi:UDPglucose 6-dehydrogenase
LSVRYTRQARTRAIGEPRGFGLEGKRKRFCEGLLLLRRWRLLAIVPHFRLLAGLSDRCYLRNAERGSACIGAATLVSVRAKWPITLALSSDEERLDRWVFRNLKTAGPEDRRDRSGNRSYRFATVSSQPAIGPSARVDCRSPNPSRSSRHAPRCSRRMNRPVCIIGTGYVGMACMIGLAELGWTVHGYDIATDRIERLRMGMPPYREHGLQESLKRHAGRGCMHFFDSLAEAVVDAAITIIAVGTPSYDDGSADLSALESVLAELSHVRFATWPTVVIRSTVPPGTCDRLAPLVEPWGELVYAPVFLREGSAVRDFLAPSRIVVGARKASITMPYLQLFEALQRPIVYTSLCNAELVKGCSNAFLAMKITYANEVANLCDALGTCCDDVLRGMGYDPRIGGDFLRPGIGFGGPCFEKDVKSIQHVAMQLATSRELFSATLRANERQPMRVIEMLEEEIGSIEGATIGVWGLAFKAGTDDVRTSLAIRIIEELAVRGAVTTAYDPAVHIAPLPAGCRLVRSAVEAADADALIVLTDWPEFAAIEPLTFAHMLRRRVVVDGCNVLDARSIAAAGLTYRGIGRPGRRVAQTASLASRVVKTGG